MRIPQRVDQWIVFVLMSCVGFADLVRRPLPDGAVAWAGIPIMYGVLFTAAYLAWRAAFRVIARLFGVVPESTAIRVFANVSFLLLVAAMFVPIRTHAELVAPFAYQR